MATLPQLLEEDVQLLDQVLGELLASTEATAALIIDQGGFLIASRGEAQQFDFTTIAALASGAYLATQTIANLLEESTFDSVYHQGERLSLFVMRVDEFCLLTVIFRAESGVGLVKYFSAPAAGRIATQLQAACSRSPGEGLDLSELNLADASGLFKRKPGML